MEIVRSLVRTFRRPEIGRRIATVGVSPVAPIEIDRERVLTEKNENSVITAQRLLAGPSYARGEAGCGPTVLL